MEHNIDSKTEVKRSVPIRKGTLLGQLVKKVTAAIGIKPCDGCERRAESLNRFKFRL